MISVGSRDGRKRLGLGLEMEDTELEEGEALGYNDVDGDSTVDPDIALSYIEEKLQNVLGHFQKDFEGGVSAENLGAKFGGYGSFLPTYQRSPSVTHNHASPRSSRKLHSEDQIQNSFASSAASPSARPHAASGKTSSLGNYSKGGVCLPSTKAEESTPKCGVTRKSVDPSDQRTLKVRIKVGAENLSTQKNADIYSGLGLVVSPSSSLDDSPSTSEGLCGDQLDVPEESPTSILQIMTSFPTGVLLSPLSEDLIYLTEKRKPRVRSDSKPVDKTSVENPGTPANGSRFSRSNPKVLEHKKLRSSEKDGAFSMELTNQKSYGDQDNTSSLTKKEKETNLDTLGCEELVSNALRLPLLSSSEYAITDPVKSMSVAAPMIASKGPKEETFSEGIVNGRLGSKFSQDIGSVENLRGRMGSSGKASESKKENLVSNIATYSQQDVLEAVKPHSSDQSESNVPKARSTRSAEPTDSSKQIVVQKGGSSTDEGFKPARENSTTGSKKKQKGLKNQLIADSSVTANSGKLSYGNGLLSKTDSQHLPKDSEKPVDRYKEFFGDVEFEDGDKESMSGEMAASGRLKDPRPLIKRSMNERPIKSKEKHNIRSSEKPRPSETYPRVGSHVAPPLGNEPNSEAPSLMVPSINEDWVCCERCQKWRLLPLDIDPDSLPDEWLCRMLTWLPNMNRCSVPQEVTTNSVRAFYHPVAAVPAPGTEGQQDRLNNPASFSVGVASVDARYPGQEQQNLAIKTSTSSGKKKHGSKNPANSTDLDGSTHSSNSKKKSLPVSIRNGNPNSGNHTPSLDACGYQHVQKSSSDVEKLNDNKKDKNVSLSDKGTNLKIRPKRESDLDNPKPSKRVKGEELRDNENWTSDNDEAFSKAGRGSTPGLSINASGHNRHKYTNHKNPREDSKKNIVVETNREMHVPGTSADGLPRSSKSDDKDSVRKRKWKEHSNSQIHTEPLSSSGRHHRDSGDFVEEMCENGPRKEKKARVSKSGVKDSSGSKANAGKDQKGRSTKEHSVTANSSSSKVSGSHKKKTSTQEVNGSPVESVSSSPLRFSVSNADKVTSTQRNLEKNNIRDSGSLTAVSPRRFSVGEDDGGNDQSGMVKKDPILTVNGHDTDVYSERLHQNNQYTSGKHSSGQCEVEVKINADQSRNRESHSKKSGKGLSSHSKDRDHASGSDLEKEKTKASDFPHDSLTNMQIDEEKSKNRRIQLDEKSGAPRQTDKIIVKKDAARGTISESSKGQSKIKSGSHDGQDKRQNLQQEYEDEKLHKKHSQAEVNGNAKSHLLPPLARVQTETGSQKQSGLKVLAADALDNGDSLKASYLSKRAENQNGQPIILRHSTPNSHKVRDVEAPSPVRRDSSSYTANSALKEAKDLKHAADRLKNSGSTDSNGFYFQAALKFLQGASLLESGSGEGTKHNEIMHAVHIYSSTAKLCDFCAREYERSKDMAAAALAYKCMEVAYMRVVYSANTNASRDRIELQSALQIVPPGESPSSSASDVDNLNHQGTTDKASLAKVIESPQVSGSHIITSRNRTGVSRLLSFAENVNLAMEASRKSRNAFMAAASALRETTHKEGIFSVKKALDFNFQDVEVLLRLIRVAMEDITR